MSSIDFIQTDTQEIYEEVISSLENSCSEELYPGDERRIFGEALVSLVTALYSGVNDSCRQRLLRYARGEVLDALGENRGVARKDAVAATTTLRFSLTAAIETNIIISAGTRATGDFVRYFATDQTAVLPAGSTYVDVAASATVGGSEGNDISAGKIKQLVDQIAYIDAVANTTATSGGADQEDDDTYRERIRSSTANVSVAGPASAYRYWALTADPTISDAYVHSPGDGEVEIVPICAGGVIPSEAILAKVLAACSADDVRPLTDSVSVAAPTAVSFDIEFKYYVSSEDESKAIETIEGDGGAIDRYIFWQTSALGRDINPDQLRKLVLAPNWGDDLAGARRLEIVSPDLTTVDADEVAQFSGTLTVTHEVEDD